MPVLKVRDPNTGQYVPLMSGSGSETNEVTISDTAPTDGTELWLDTAAVGGTEAYVLKGGDTMTGGLVLGAHPTSLMGATTKQYVDGSGGFISLSAGVGSSTLNKTQLTTIDIPAITWGSDVISSGASLKVTRAGYYKCTLQGGGSSNGAGTIRLLAIADFDNSLGIPPHSSNANWIGQHSVPSANTSGLGAVMSASGIWWLPQDHRMVVIARQDSGATLTMSATLSIESIPGM